MVHCLLYAISQGLFCVTSLMMCSYSVYLGGKHMHHIFRLPTERYLSPHQMAEFTITLLLNTPAKLNVLRMLSILFFDKVVQLSAEILYALDIILRRICDENILLGGLLLVAIVDCTQLQLVKGRLFLLLYRDIN